MESHIRHMKEVVSKIFLDHVALIAQTNDEIRQSIMAVDFHDMPQDRTPPDLNHRLRLDRSLFRNARTQSARKNDDLHDLPKRGRRAQSATAALSFGDRSQSTGGPLFDKIRAHHPEHNTKSLKACYGEPHEHPPC